MPGKSIFSSGKGPFKFSDADAGGKKGSSKRDSDFALYKSDIRLPRRPSLPKVERAPIFTRAWAGLADATRAAENITGPPPQPESGPYAKGVATKPEWYVKWGLDRNDKIEGVDYDYRGEVELISSLATAAQLDFTMTDGSQIAIEVQGIHWHYELGFNKIAQDEVRRTELITSGWHVIQIDEDDALRDPEYYVREALAGRDHSYSSSQIFYQPWS